MFSKNGPYNQVSINLEPKENNSLKDLKENSSRGFQLLNIQNKAVKIKLLTKVCITRLKTPIPI